ncbi:MAG: cadherin repeat domain-containing protein, partial [Planctomycetaceae bacterium]|nr:cadherin repeat domain-containing protein [Planctomycetaceae bacterium]
DSSTGLRRIASLGPIQGTSFTLTGLTPGLYYWSVQAIDTALAGSPFATEESVTLNTVPVLGGAVANQGVNDNATISPFMTFTVADPDAQSLSALVNIHNGTNRGDFTAASTVGWIRTVVGTEIRYTRTFPAGMNSDAVVQAAIRALVFQPRENAILPNTTENTAFIVGVSDGVATPVSNGDTTVITTSINNPLAVGGGTGNQTVSENSTIAPFTSITVTDPDTQDLFVRVTILSGVFRGDFTPASATGWTSSVAGNNILYDRYYSPAANIGAAAQADIQALVFQPRSGAINPGTSEETDFLVYVTDGITSVTNSTTSTITTTINTPPTIGGADSMVAVNDNTTVNPFSTLTVTDPDMQQMLISVTILNGVFRGDFTNANSGTGWTIREVVGNNITYKQYFSPRANVGADAQSAFRALIFQPRSNSIPVGSTEVTDFQVTVSDSVAPAVANTDTSVTTTSVNDTPTDIGLTNNSVNENSPNATVGLLTTTDPDFGDTFTYSIQPGGNGNQFVISGNTLKVGTTPLDFEAGMTRSLTIRTTDQLGEFFDKVFS